MVDEFLPSKCYAGCARDNKDPLLSVIEPFIRDPTVAWGRGGRAQRGGDETSVRGRRQHQEQQFEDTENANAGNILKNISERLDGCDCIRPLQLYYNIIASTAFTTFDIHMPRIFF